MKLQFTPEQTAQVAAHMKPGFALLGRVIREVFDGTNPDTCGKLSIELGAVPEASLPALRDVIRNVGKPKRAKGKSTKGITAAKEQ